MPAKRAALQRKNQQRKHNKSSATANNSHNNSTKSKSDNSSSDLTSENPKVQQGVSVGSTKTTNNSHQTTNPNNIQSYSSEAIVLCRKVASTLPSIELWGQFSIVGCSKFEFVFYIIHFLLIHFVLHGHEVGAGMFAWAVIVISVGLTVTMYQLIRSRITQEKDAVLFGGMPFDLVFTFILPLVAIASSSLRTNFVSDPYFVHPSAPPHRALLTSVGWLILPAALHVIFPPFIFRPLSCYENNNKRKDIGIFSAGSRTTAVSPTSHRSITKNNNLLDNTIKINLSSTDHSFIVSCLETHDPTFQPTFIGAIIRMSFRSFKLSFWCVIAPCVMQTWAPLYFNTTMCVVAFVSAWVGGMVLGLTDMLRMRIPRVLAAIRMQGWWYTGGGGGGEIGINRSSKVDVSDLQDRVKPWNPMVIYAQGDVVSIKETDGAVVTYTAAAFDNGPVFSNPVTWNGAVVRRIAINPKLVLSQMRLVVMFTQLLLSGLLVVCCISSPFWIRYVVLFVINYGVFYICDNWILPMESMLKLIKLFEFGTSEEWRQAFKVQQAT